MRLFIPGLILCCAVAHADDRPPRSTDPRIAIELFAEQPQVHTPTGIDVDERGRVWVIESNTHFRPDDYDGPPSDRLLIMQDTDGDGRADDVTTFADGFTYTMSVAVRPVWMERVGVEEPDVSARGSEGEQEPAQEERELPQGADAPRSPEQSRVEGDRDAVTQVFLATRREIMLLEDLDGDDACDRQTTLIRLETEGNYPHNGLAGFAFDALDWVYFGLGENLGEDYTIVGRDGASFSGGGEGGNIYRMRPDGAHLAHWATGFWNPHASCVDAFGRMFTVDNDPDSRPPCRLLHIIEGGDYGYRFRNGRKGLHPFTAWNGEIPGTLPMVAGTGEAPSGIVAYEHHTFPEDYLGDLIVTSWGDHRIDRFVLRPHGASFESLAQPLIVGGENFRPVGIALAPDGSLYCSDWVLRDYNLHGQGRVWRISAVDAGDAEPDAPSLPERRLAARRAAQSHDGREALLAKLQDERQPLRDRIEALWALARVPPSEEQLNLLAFDDRGQTILWQADEVSLAALDLVGSPQMPFPNPPPDGLVPEFNRQSTVAALVIAVRLAGRYLPSDSTAGVIYFAALEANDPFLQHIIRTEMRRYGDVGAIATQFDSARTAFDVSGSFRLAAFLISREAFPDNQSIVLRGLHHPLAAIRERAVQWAAEEGMTELRPDVAAVLQSEPMNSSLFLATLAALEMLDGKDPKDFDQTPAGQYVLPLLQNADTPAAVKVQALRLVDPADPALTTDILRGLLETSDRALRLEAVRTAAFSPLDDAAKWLLSLAADEEEDATLRAEAILGLANVVARDLDSGETAREMCALLPNLDLDLKTDMFRSLRVAAATDPEVLEAVLDSVGERTGEASAWTEIDAQLRFLLPEDRTQWPRQVLLPEPDPRPAGDQEWRAALETSLDGEEQRPDRGHRVFFHPNGPRCYACHTVNGRGGNIGPDLSTIGRALARERLLDSILDPSREIAPQFTTWNMLTTEGQVHTGMIVHENKGTTVLGTVEGELIELQTIDIDLRTPQRTSVMPDRLEERMTVEEFRDLLAFLQSLGKE